MVELLPALDVIPLPAPVWLVKVLHLLTLTFHFAFLSLLWGGLVLGLFWNLNGRLRRDPVSLNASGIVATRLPIVTTFVINLGIPPLLFLQLLYGHIVYTSTLLVAVLWLSIIIAVLTAYSLLYKMATSAVRKTAWWGWAFLALLLLGHVALVYSTVSALMLRPEGWPSIYDATASGTGTPPHDPSLLPRWITAFLGFITFGSLGTALYTSKATLANEVRTFIRRSAGWAGILFLPLLAAAGIWAYQTQPEFIRHGLQQTEIGQGLLSGWMICVGLSLLSALHLALFPGRFSGLAAHLIVVPPILALAQFALLRDLIRDLAMVRSGYDVWTAPVQTNWQVLGAFLVFLAAGLALMIWMLIVVRRMKPTEEHYA